MLHGCGYLNGPLNTHCLGCGERLLMIHVEADIGLTTGLIVVHRTPEELEAYEPGGIFHEAPKHKHGPHACGVCGTYFSEDPSRWAIDRGRSLDAIARLQTDPVIEEAKRALAMGDDQRLCNSCHLYVVHGRGAAHAICDHVDDRYGPEPGLEPLTILQGLLDYATDQRKFLRRDEEQDERMVRGSMARRIQIVIDRLTDLERAVAADPDAVEVLSRLERERRAAPVLTALVSAKGALRVIYENESKAAPERFRSVHHLLYTLDGFEKGAQRRPKDPT